LHSRSRSEDNKRNQYGVKRKVSKKGAYWFNIDQALITNWIDGVFVANRAIVGLVTGKNSDKQSAAHPIRTNGTTYNNSRIEYRAPLVAIRIVTHTNLDRAAE
jgi:hypothetical protein